MRSCHLRRHLDWVAACYYSCLLQRRAGRLSLSPFFVCFWGSSQQTIRDSKDFPNFAQRQRSMRDCFFRRQHKKISGNKFRNSNLNNCRRSATFDYETECVVYVRVYSEILTSRSAKPSYWIARYDFYGSIGHMWKREKASSTQQRGGILNSTQKFRTYYISS